MGIYYWGYPRVFSAIITIVVIWGVFSSGMTRECFKWAINFAAFSVATYGVMSYCILGRQCTDIHVVIFVSNFNGEFFRELVMNVFLYVPVGATLPFILPKEQVNKQAASILIALLMSVCIEYWQYIQGTGIAQISDLVMNTVGASIGTTAYAISHHIEFKCKLINKL